MILRRLGGHLKDQNWAAIAVEFVMVVAGVFLGIAAANWNEERLERRQTRELLGQLQAELAAFEGYLDSMDDYYRIAGRFAEVAEAGWRGAPGVDDNAFVIAAYQASQINGVGNNGAVWSAIFGADSLRDIEDRAVRENLARLMTFDYKLVDLASVSTRYREEVRKVIPDAVQAAIRERCGDRPLRAGIRLPERCDLRLDPAAAESTAEALRSRSHLPAELNWHRAAVTTQLFNIASLRSFVATLNDQLSPAGTARQ